MTMEGLLELTPQIQEFLKALAGETRQRILMLFVDGKERTVGQIAAEARLGQPSASEHLAILRRGGLVVSRREGKEVYYLPDRALIAARLRALSGLLEHCCGAPGPDRQPPG
jgi:DNA-binding transcriptional ArsR family regulator